MSHSISNDANMFHASSGGGCTPPVNGMAAATTLTTSPLTINHPECVGQTVVGGGYLSGPKSTMGPLSVSTTSSINYPPQQVPQNPLDHGLMDNSQPTAPSLVLPTLNSAINSESNGIEFPLDDAEPKQSDYAWIKDKKTSRKQNQG